MKNRKKHAAVAAAVAVFVILIGCIYYRFITNTIYNESISHLEELFHQADIAMSQMVETTFSNVHIWADYLESVNDEDEIVKSLGETEKKAGFSEFYFISRSGKYISLSGETGYLNFKSNLTDLINSDSDVMFSSAIPGSPEMLVFASPAEKAEFRGFEYEAIAAGYSRKDIVDRLKIKVFDGLSACFVIHGNGRVILDTKEDDRDVIYNLISSFEKVSDMSKAEIKSLAGDFAAGKSGSRIVSLNGEKCYLLYEPVGVDDWVMVSAVSQKAVNAGMNKIQSLAFVMVAIMMIIIGSIVVAAVVRRNRLMLKEKDSEILSRDEMFDKVSTSSDDVFMMLDGYDLNVSYISPNIENLLGVSAEKATGDIYAMCDILQEAEAVPVWDELPFMKAGEHREWDREYIHQKTKDHRWFHVTAFCSETAGNRKYIIVMSDRTNDVRIKKELEAAVAAAEDALCMAESANRAKSTFLSNMSHDIRTPMNAIIGYATLGLAGSDDTDRVKDYLSKILSSGSHLLSLINDILDMSRIESGKITLEETENNLSDILHDIKTIVSGQINAKQLELFMDAIDVTDEDVFCDRTRFSQLLLNLLSNAIKFTPSGGTVAVRIAQLENSTQGMGTYEIRVRDTGIGMSPEFAEKLFEPFERERTSTVSKTQGTGLGMPIAKSIVDMMGGTIDFITEKNKGTEFIVKVDLRISSRKKKNSARIEVLEGLRALIADDDYNTCDSVSKMLSKVGMRPDWTISGREALIRARHAHERGDGYNAYIIDWRLPDVNGIEVARQIRSMGDNTPIIILTAYDWDNIADEARAAGVTAFCSKPMFMSDLREALLSSIEGTEEEKHDILQIDDENGFAGRRVLVAEDNDFNREIAVEILSVHGFTVDTAENGQAAVDRIVSSEPGFYDLVLMDIQMPVMDGYEATRRIRSFGDSRISSVPIIAMTANAFNEDKEAAIESGMDGFLSKPVDMGSLVSELRRIFAEREEFWKK